MSNPANSVNIIGRLAADPVVFANKDNTINPDGTQAADNSNVVSFAVYADRDYRDGEGNTPSDKLPLRVFIRKGVKVETTPFASIHKGDLVAVQAELRVGKPYQDKTTGDTIYPEPKIEVQSIKFLESRAVTGRRLSERVAAANQVNDSAAAPVVTEAPVTQAPAQVQDANVPTFGDVPAFGN